MSDKENPKKKRPLQKKGVWARTEVLANSTGVRRPESENLGNKEKAEINSGSESNGVVNDERDKYNEIQREINDVSNGNATNNEKFESNTLIESNRVFNDEKDEYHDIEQEINSIYDEINGTKPKEDIKLNEIPDEVKEDHKTQKGEPNGAGTELEVEDSEIESNKDSDTVLEDTVLATSKLNPFAEEFIPVFEQHKEHEEPKNMRLPISGNKRLNNSPDDTFEGNDDEEDFLIDFNDSMNFYYNQITCNPAMFDDCMSILSPNIEEYIKHTDKADVMAVELINLGIPDSTFAYFAVKLACYMIEKERQLINGISLRDAILDEAQLRVEDILNNVLVNSKANTKTLSSQLMFLSELYLQLEIGGRRMAPIGESLIDICISMKEAEHIPIAERLINIVSAIKLTGQFLEEHASTKLNILMGPLWIYADRRREEIGEDTFKLVNDLIELRYTHKWNRPSSSGQANNSNEVEQQEAQAACDNYDDVVCYGPDGNVLSQEEQLFLNCSDDLSPDVECEPSPSGMDNEMYEAYDEFLAELQKTEEPDTEPEAQWEHCNGQGK